MNNSIEMFAHYAEFRQWGQLEFKGGFVTCDTTLTTKQGKHTMVNKQKCYKIKKYNKWQLMAHFHYSAV